MDMTLGFRPILKPQMIIDFIKGKLGIELSDQLASYNSPVRKSSIWYKKIAIDLLSIAVVNSIIIFNEINTAKMTILKSQEMIVEKLLNIRDPSPTLPVLNITHKLTNIPRKPNGRIVQRRCTGCNKKMTSQTTASTARKGAKEVFHVIMRFIIKIGMSDCQKYND